jgi:hypothetical protein
VDWRVVQPIHAVDLRWRLKGQSRGCGRGVSAASGAAWVGARDAACRRECSLEGCVWRRCRVLDVSEETSQHYAAGVIALEHCGGQAAENPRQSSAPARGTLFPS